MTSSSGVGEGVAGARWRERRDGILKFPDLVFYHGGLGIDFRWKWPCGLQKLEGLAFRSPPKWNEYIPKKNRHSESVNDPFGQGPTPV